MFGFLALYLDLMASSTREVYDIKKFDGSNFALWIQQIQDVLVQKKQRLPILYAQRERRHDTNMVRESQPSCTISLIVTRNSEWLTKCSYTLMVSK